MARKKARAKSGGYIISYGLMGLILAFICVVGFFGWGFIGVSLSNILRLGVGETYPILYVFIFMWSTYSLLTGRLYPVTFKQLIGILFIFFSLTTLFHFRAFYPNLAPNNMMASIYQVFKNDFVMVQIQSPMGGGWMGSFFYVAFAYLFGPWGTYLLVFCLFFAGLFMTVGVTWQAFVSSLHVLWQSLWSWLGQLPSREEIKQVLQNPASNPTQEAPDLADSVPDKRSRSPRPQSSWLTRLGLGRSDKGGDHPWQTSYEPSFSKEFSRDFDPYSQDDKLAQTAQTHRDKVLGQVLDLDYFDKMLDQDSEGASVRQSHLDKVPQVRSEGLEEAGEEEVLARPGVASYRELAETDPVLDISWIQSDPDQAPSLKAPASSQTKPDQLESSDAEPAELATPTSVKARPRDLDLDPGLASHWVQGAQSSQNLTDDVLETALKEDPYPVTSKKKPSKTKRYQLPSKDLLNTLKPVDQSEEYAHIKQNIEKLERTFDSFGVDARVVQANLGPAVTKYEIEPAIGVKVSKIVSLADDIALALAARDVRIEAPIPGKSLIGIEVPNKQVSPVSFREVIDPALKSTQVLEVPLGRDVTGTVSLADLSKMPHLLIAGATGSGKSVGMNVIICSLLMKARPEEVKFLMIDPKKVELTLYNDLPHLLAPVVTDPRKAAKALNNIVQEMERRYELFAGIGVRNADAYNDLVQDMDDSQQLTYEKLPKIVVFIDELADLMLVASNEVETAIIRLAQMARAAGIHMIIATQRPSVDVITGIIKANIPSRLAFAVSSGTDSRTILDAVGAEKLLGRGDMLFQPMGRNKPIRVQGAYISDSEVERITNFIKDQASPNYDENILVTDASMEISQASEDEYFEDAIQLIRGTETISISQLQRHFRIGYNRAARLIDDLEAMGYVSEQDGSKPRQVLLQ